MSFNFKTILFVLSFYIGAGPVFSMKTIENSVYYKENNIDNINVNNNKKKNNTQEFSKLESVYIQHWYKNFSQYQKILVPETEVNYYKRFNIEYLNKIFCTLCFLNDKKSKKQDSYYNDMFEKLNKYNTNKDSLSFNYGYAVIEFTYGNLQKLIVAIDVNKKVFYCYSQRNINENTTNWKELLFEDNTEIPKSYQDIIDRANKKHEIIRGNDDEIKILDIIYRIKENINGNILQNQTIQNIKVDLFTYMDMCPSCWTVWDKSYRSLKEWYNCSNLEVNVYSVKPYCFLDHPFLECLIKMKDTFLCNDQNRITHSIVKLDDFDKTYNTCMRRNYQNNDNFIQNNTSNINQYIDMENINSLRLFYEDVIKNDNNEINKLKENYSKVMNNMDDYFNKLFQIACKKYIPTHNTIRRFTSYNNQKELNNVYKSTLDIITSYLKPDYT